MSETIISIDVETDGPIPGRNSMLSLGAVAFSESGTELSAFQVNILPLPEAAPNPETMTWWAGQPKAWSAITEGAQAASDAAIRFSRWLGEYEHPVAVGYPVTFDFMFVYWYLIAFTGRSPFGFQGRDIKTMAADALGIPFKSATKRNMPREWFDPSLKHTHIPVDDAREQGRLYFAILNHIRGTSHDGRTLGRFPR